MNFLYFLLPKYIAKYDTNIQYVQQYTWESHSLDLYMVFKKFYNQLVLTLWEDFHKYIKHVMKDLKKK